MEEVALSWLCAEHVKSRNALAAPAGAANSLNHRLSPDTIGCAVLVVHLVWPDASFGGIHSIHGVHRREDL